jgi:hypothetical protein
MSFLLQIGIRTIFSPVMLCRIILKIMQMNQQVFFGRLKENIKDTGLC